MADKYAIICGGRDYNPNKNNFNNEVERILYKEKITDVVEGGAIGADREGRNIANKLGLRCHTFKADWDMKDPEYKNDPVRIAYNYSGKQVRSFNKLAGITYGRICK